jgi:hypothetical protein
MPINFIDSPRVDTAAPGAHTERADDPIIRRFLTF